MTHRIRRFLQLLLSLLFALNLLGCSAQQRVVAPLQFSQMTLQSLHERNLKALATTVCEILARGREKDQVRIGSRSEGVRAIPSICGYHF
jgi:hypothetical protein